MLSGEALPHKASKSIKAVAFDLDGTLYPNYRLYCRLLPRFFIHPFFYRAFMAARHELHSGSADPQGFTKSTPSGGALSFYEKQALLMARFLGKDPEKTRIKMDRLIYRGWERVFSRIRLFPRVKETLSAFRTAGLKLGMLSDFPPVQKVSLLGLDGCFDVILAAEETGALKPSGIPFAILARELAFDPGEILYVGNSPRFDTEGAKTAGMKAALIRRGLFSTGRVKKNDTGGADFVFRDYRQLQEYVLLK